MVKRSKAWGQEEIEPKARIRGLTLGAFEIQRFFTLCVELILSSSKAFGRIVPESGIVSFMQGSGACRGIRF